MDHFLRILFILLVLPSAAWAQKQGMEQPGDLPFVHRKAQTTLLNAALPTGNAKLEDAIVAYLVANHPNFINPLNGLQLVAVKTSPGGRHFTFNQTYNGWWLAHAPVKVNMDAHEHIRSITDNSYATQAWDLKTLENEVNALLQHHPIQSYQEQYPEVVVEQQQMAIAMLDNYPQAVQYATIYEPKTGRHFELMLGKDATVLWQYDLNSYSDGIPANVSGKIFNPDPLTTAETIYAGQYRDFNDSNKVELTNELQTVNFTVTLDTVYELKNDRITLMEFSTPSKPPVFAVSPTFNYSRQEDGFEDVNTYYHLTYFNGYIDGLGFTDLADFLVQVDPHGLDNDDNSMYSKGGGMPRLFFGEGGVDDAEDADVVIHEYGHALSDNASPSSNFGNERSSIDEGIGDYLATSYSRSINPFRWEDMFTWDGHNEYWNGRTANSSKHYPENLTSSIHGNGEMWSSALMEIWQELGREVTDKLMFQTLYGLSSGMTMADAALLYLQADTLLYSGVHSCVIAEKFYNRGFLDSTNAPLCAIGLEENNNSFIQVLNTEGFAFSNQPVLIKNELQTRVQSILLTDVAGRILVSRQDLGDSQYFLDGSALAKGLYVLTISTAEGSKTVKLIKAKDY
ncbi:MAG: T9SS type A sorting domain-containing protein [Chitinophagales bacterium]|nr:T9SS type A sorting domain-containing protein [Chitinophagales bacterium]